MFSIDKKNHTRKKLRWKVQFTKTLIIDPCGRQHPTSIKTAENSKRRSLERDLTTSRTENYRDRLTDAVITLHQWSARNRNVDPHCPSPQSFYRPNKMPQHPTVFKNLQRPHNLQEDEPIRTPRMPDPRKPLEQRLAEYTQHRSRIYGYKLQPGVFNFSFMPH